MQLLNEIWSSFHQSKKTKHAHIYTFPERTILAISRSLFLSLPDSKLKRIFVRALAHIHTAARTLWPNSPSYWCVSVSERGAAQRATMGLCVAPREQRVVYSMPAPRLFWKHCVRLFKLWPYFELSDCMSNKEQQRGCFSVKEHWPDWPPLALVMSS